MYIENRFIIFTLIVLFDIGIEKYTNVNLMVVVLFDIGIEKFTNVNLMVVKLAKSD